MHDINKSLGGKKRTNLQLEPRPCSGVTQAGVQLSFGGSEL